MPAAEYLRSSYYEKRIESFVELLVRGGLITRGEAETGRPAPESAKQTPRLTADAVPARLARGVSASRDVLAVPRFGVGAEVLARNLNPTGHTRLPRYVRGKRGTVTRDHG